MKNTIGTLKALQIIDGAWTATVRPNRTGAFCDYWTLSMPGLTKAEAISYLRRNYGVCVSHDFYRHQNSYRMTKHEYIESKDTMIGHLNDYKHRVEIALIGVEQENGHKVAYLESRIFNNEVVDQHRLTVKNDSWNNWTRYDYIKLNGVKYWLTDFTD